MTKIAITGANGFIGSALLRSLIDTNSFEVIGFVRKLVSGNNFWGSLHETGEINSKTRWCHLLTGVDTLIHTASRVHHIGDRNFNNLELYREVNVEGTLNLARQAAFSGIKRFIFVSSIKVNGEYTNPDRPFSPEDIPNPTDSYALSKLEAEIALRDLAALTGMELVIIRPPLVYGPGVKGNFLTLMRLIKNRIPLPLGSICSMRSYISLQNLVDILVLCTTNQAASNQLFLASDGEDLTIHDLIIKLGIALNIKVCIFPVSASVLEASLQLLGKSDISKKIIRPLQVDASHMCQTLGWAPRITLDAALQESADYFLKEGKI